MLDSIIVALNAIVPFIVFLLLGYIIRHFKTFEDEFFVKANNLCFKFIFPFVTFYNCYTIDFSTFHSFKFLFIFALSVIIVAFVAFITVPFFVKENKRRGVVVQAIFRSNYVLLGVPLSMSVLGEESTGIAALGIAVVIPLYNFIAVIILEYFSGKITKGKKELIINILKNPLLLGAVFGLFFAITKVRLPGSIEQSTATLSGMATPFALIILGARFYLGRLKKNLKYILSVALIRLIILPAIILAVGLGLNLVGDQLFIYMVIFMTPTATASYVMASNMGGDGELAGQIVVITTMLSMITMFMWIFIVRQLGIV